MARKKRKYTRKKKYNFWLYFKKLIKIFLLIFILHLGYINWKIFFTDVSYSDVILITGDNKQNSKNISKNLEAKINTSLSLFSQNKAKKIFVLGQKNTFKIDETSLITQYISKKDIWEGNIAFQNSSIESYPKNTKLFLQENEWNSIIYISNFWDYYKNLYIYSQRINKDHISIKGNYNGLLDTFTGILKNYYYFWKI